MAGSCPNIFFVLCWCPCFDSPLWQFMIEDSTVTSQKRHATMTTGPKSGQQRRKLNPAFAAAHGLAGDASVKTKSTKEDSSPLERAQFAVKRARATGKLNAANIGLCSPLFDILFDLGQGVEVNLSMDRRHAESFVESTLQLVDFSDNAIGGILDDRIRRFRSIGIFRLKRCNLSGIHMDSLQFLQNLTLLDLASNQLSDFAIDALPKSIRELDLSCNRLQTLCKDCNTSVTMPNLIKLNVSHNNLSRLPIKCPSLQTLDCGHNCISEISQEFLNSTSRSLTTLDARENSITTCLNLSKCTSLKVVVLAHNQLTGPPVIHTDLARLILSENKLSSLEGLFQDDSTEHSQHLRDNRLETLDSAVVQRLLHIRLLDLCNNNLANLPSVLGYLPNVQKIFLDGNPLRTLASVSRKDARSLQALLRKRGPAPSGSGYLPQETDGNSYASVDSTAESNSNNSSSTKSKSDILSSALVGNTALNLEGRKLTQIPAALLDELRGSSRVAERIQVLKVSQNALETINGDLFALLPLLKTVEADQNCLKELPSEIRTSSLSALSLARNQLTANSIVSGFLGNSPCFQMQNTLTELDLSSNRLEYLPSALLDFASLRSLNLSNNRIASLAIDRSLSSGWKRGLPVLETLDLSDNRIDNLGDLPLILGEACPLLKTLLLQNNEIKAIPPSLGMLTSLRCIDLRGNPQRAVRNAVLEKGCEAILIYLRNRMTPAELQDFEMRQRAMSESVTVSMPEPLESTANREGESHWPSDAIHEASALVDELRTDIDALSFELNNVHLSEPQKYANRKKLAALNAKLIKEERRLRQENQG